MHITDKRTIQTYYQALLHRDSKYLGIFYVGVKTTSVFCIATCRARKPKAENVIFYNTVKHALDSGFRPCKICRPTENGIDVPAAIKTAIRLVQDNPKQKISDYQLRQHKLQPEQVRRWFNKNYGMTFHAYQRMYRINQALLELKQGKSATETAFDSGYESLSGFAYTYKKILGQSPKNSIGHNPIFINRLNTPIGPMFICADEVGVCLLEFVDRKMLETEFKDLQKRLNNRIILGENQHIIKARNQLGEYFTGKRKAFSVCLNTPGTEFQQHAWHALQDINYAQTSSYLKQAESMQKATAVRAVARANGMNKVSIIIPCHRVIAANGSLGGYGGGLERKRWLLDHEQKNAV